ncbi:Ig family protein (fragment) [Candidatus Sulfopaludibacter sp. SbA3]
MIPVTLQILGPSPLSALPAAPSLSYTKGSGTPASVNVALSASAAATPSFTVDTTSLPPWLTVDAVTGTIPRSLRFTTTSVADSKAQGAYSATVHVQVSGYADLGVPFGLTVSSVAPVLTVAEGTSRNLSWAVGQPLPIPYITLASSGSTIAYSIATSGVLAPVISDSFLKGLVYSYGTPIPVTFDQDVFATAQPGSILSGTVTVTWGSPASTTVITINIAVQSAEATLADVSPLSLPAAAPGQTFTVALSGTGFTASPDARQRTVVGIVSAKSLVADANIASTVVDSAVIILTITVPTAADPLLPFAPAGPGGTVTLGVCNPMGTACSTPTGTAALTIDIKPVIQVVTSASSFVQASPLALATVAPYDMVSLFGFNFCTAGGTGCGKATLFGAVAPATLHYPTSLTPDKSASPRLLTVAFQTQATPPVAIANAPLLFATDGQINLLVPSAVAAFIGKSVDMVVKFGSSSGAPFPVNIAAADPGIFTLSSDGQGEGAVLDSDWSMVTRGNEAGMRQTAADSDIVQMYVTGLGVPDGAADNGSSGTGLWPADCVTTASFLTSLNSLTSGSFTTLDGVFLSRGLLNTGRLLPCLRSAGNVPSVTIGGQPATVTYAGWVPDSVAGLYQLNVRLPGSGAGTFTTASGATIAGPLTVPVQLPVTIAVHGSNSQAGVTMWVAPQLKVTGPVGAALQGTVGAKWSATGSLVTASEGTGPYQYAVTGGSLPGGVTLDAVSGAISGTPAANAAGAYTVTVTATDSAVAPLTGSAAFTLTVNAAH